MNKPILNDKGQELAKIFEMKNVMVFDAKSAAATKKFTIPKVPAGVFPFIGKRKTSVATVYIWENEGNKGVFSFNKDHFLNKCYKAQDVDTLISPFVLLGKKLSEYNIVCTTKGGGSSACFDAIKLALSRAFLRMDESFRQILKPAGMLTRDSRMVESKLTGRPKARKKKQFSKR